MDVQKKVEEFLLEWNNITKENIYEMTMSKISSFKKIKNIKIFLKLLIKNLERQTNQIIIEMKDKSIIEKRKYIQKFRREVEKIDCIKDIYKEFKNSYDEELKKEEFTKVKVVIKEPIKNVETLKKNIEENILECELPHSIEIFSNYIKKCNLQSDSEQIITYTDFLCYSLVEYLFDNNEIFIEFEYLLNSLKNKVNQYEKNTLEREFFKDIQKRFKNIYKIYSNNKELKSNKDAYFEIVDYYLEKENYFSIQELIKRKPEICNITNENGHIVLHILNKYIDNFKKMTNNKNSNYINVKYLKEVYELFTKSPHFRMKYEEKQNVDLVINEFIVYLKSTLIKRRRKNYAIAEAKSMKSNNFYCYKEQFDIREFREDNISYERQRLINLIDDYMTEDRCNDAIDAFVLGNNAYTLTTEEGNTILKMHSLNISPFARRESVLGAYLEQCEFKNEKVDDFILRGFKFKSNKQYPVITYNLEFYQSGKLKNLTINENNINITNIYNTMYSKNTEQQEFYDFYKKSVSKNGGNLTTFDTYKINEHFEGLLQLIYSMFIRRNQLPFIYYGYKKQTENELDESKNFLATKFNGLEKKDMIELIDILTSRIDKFHYSQFPIENPVYDLKIIDSISFLGLENQRMLNDIYFNKRNIEDPKKLLNLKKEYYQYYDKKIDELNKSINYIDMEKVKKYRGKMIVKKIFY